MSWAFERERVPASVTIPRRRSGCSIAAGYPRSRRRRSAPAVASDAEDIDFGGLPRSRRRRFSTTSRASAWRSTSARASSRRSSPTSCAGNFQLYTLQFVGVTDPDMLRRVFHSRQVPPAGLNRVFYRNPDVDELIDAAAREVDDERRASVCGRRSDDRRGRPVHRRSGTRPTSRCFSRISRACRLSPIADFAFLKDVSAAGGASVRRPRALALTLIALLAGASRPTRRTATIPGCGSARSPHHGSTSTSTRAKSNWRAGWR